MVGIKVFGFRTPQPNKLVKTGLKVITATVEQQPQFFQNTGRRETTTTIFIMLWIQKGKDIKLKEMKEGDRTWPEKIADILRFC